MQPQTSYKGPGHSFGYPTTENPYQIPQAPNHRKQIFMMIGGGIAVLILLLIVVNSGGSKPGQPEMQSATQNTGEALAILNSYQSNLSLGDSQNNGALMQILLIGNYQALSKLYNSTYHGKKSFPSNLALDASSKSTLDGAERNNQLDSQLVSTLQPKIATALAQLKKAAPDFKRADNKAIVAEAQSDLTSINEILSAN